MTDKKKTKPKPEKQAVKKQPTDLTDEQLDEAHGGGGVTAQQPASSGPIHASNQDLKVLDPPPRPWKW